jgi:hypothetical protein
MNIKKLTEKASKGPFEIMLDQMIYERLPCSVGDDERHLAWCYKKEDAQLITHCLNNFQPLLEALEGLQACIMETRGIDAYQANWDAQKAIKEATEVQV